MKRLSCYDGLVSLFPYALLTFVYSGLYPLCTLLYVLIAQPEGYSLLSMFWVVLSYYIFLYGQKLFTDTVTIIREHKRMRTTPRKMFKYIFVLPLIFILQQYVQTWAILLPRVKWKKIPHVVGKTIEEMNEEKTVAEHIAKEKQPVAKA